MNFDQLDLGDLSGDPIAQDFMNLGDSNPLWKMPSDTGLADPLIDPDAASAIAFLNAYQDDASLRISQNSLSSGEGLRRSISNSLEGRGTSPSQSQALIEAAKRNIMETGANPVLLDTLSISATLPDYDNDDVSSTLRLWKASARRRLNDAVRTGKTLMNQLKIFVETPIETLANASDETAEVSRIWIKSFAQDIVTRFNTLYTSAFITPLTNRRAMTQVTRNILLKKNRDVFALVSAELTETSNIQLTVRFMGRNIGTFDGTLPSARPSATDINNLRGLMEVSSDMPVWHMYDPDGKATQTFLGIVRRMTPTITFAPPITEHVNLFGWSRQELIVVEDGPNLPAAALVLPSKSQARTRFNGTVLFTRPSPFTYQTFEEYVSGAEEEIGGEWVPNLFYGNDQIAISGRRSLYPLFATSIEVLDVPSYGGILEPSVAYRNREQQRDSTAMGELIALRMGQWIASFADEDLVRKMASVSLAHLYGGHQGGNVISFMITIHDVEGTEIARISPDGWDLIAQRRAILDLSIARTRNYVDVITGATGFTDNLSNDSIGVLVQTLALLWHYKNVMDIIPQGELRVDLRQIFTELLASRSNSIVRTISTRNPKGRPVALAPPFSNVQKRDIIEGLRQGTADSDWQDLFAETIVPGGVSLLSGINFGRYAFPSTSEIVKSAGVPPNQPSPSGIRPLSQVTSLSSSLSRPGASGLSASGGPVNFLSSASGGSRLPSPGVPPNQKPRGIDLGSLRLTDVGSASSPEPSVPSTIPDRPPTPKVPLYPSLPETSATKPTPSPSPAPTPTPTPPVSVPSTPSPAPSTPVVSTTAPPRLPSPVVQPARPRPARPARPQPPVREPSPEMPSSPRSPVFPFMPNSITIVKPSLWATNSATVSSGGSAAPLMNVELRINSRVEKVSFTKLLRSRDGPFGFVFAMKYIPSRKAMITDSERKTIGAENDGWTIPVNGVFRFVMTPVNKREGVVFEGAYSVEPGEKVRLDFDSFVIEMTTSKTNVPSMAHLVYLKIGEKVARPF